MTKPKKKIGTFIGFRIEADKLLKIMDEVKKEIEREVDEIDLKETYLPEIIAEKIINNQK